MHIVVFTRETYRVLWHVGVRYIARKPLEVEPVLVVAVLGQIQ